MRCIALLAGVVALAAAPASDVFAGGWDTPILSTARYIGAGGTAIAHVDDPAAVYLNPAGIAHTRWISTTASLSPFFGHVETPVAKDGETKQSELIVSPAFLVGAAYRVQDWLVLGLGVYPVAAAGATYEYDKTTDETKAVVIEASPGVAIDFNMLGWGNWRLGAGYRVSMVSIDRYKKVEGGLTFFDFSLQGLNFAGFRVGLQWTPMQDLDLGIVYRHKTETTMEADKGTNYNTEFRDVSMGFVLPSRLGVGARYQLRPVVVAVDVEWLFNSQNGQERLAGTQVKDDFAAGLDVPYYWDDTLIARVGFEYRGLDRWAFRLGYTYDGKTSTETYPTAFGTPPAPTHSATAGVGYEGDGWELNLAYAYRNGGGTVPNDAEDDREVECRTCSYGGDYGIVLHGTYLDFSYYWY